MGTSGPWPGHRVTLRAQRRSLLLGPRCGQAEFSSMTTHHTPPTSRLTLGPTLPVSTVVVAPGQPQAHLHCLECVLRGEVRLCGHVHVRGCLQQCEQAPQPPRGCWAVPGRGPVSSEGARRGPVSECCAAHRPLLEELEVAGPWSPGREPNVLLSGPFSCLVCLFWAAVRTSLLGLLPSVRGWSAVGVVPSL